MKPHKINPSMLDVARHIGVSIATVSNVINKPEKVSPETIERVRKAINELGYVRNDAARSLATGSTRSVGMVIADLDNSLFVDLAHGAQQGADAAGMRLILGNAACSVERQDDYLHLFDEARVAGLLLAPMEDSLACIERMRAHGRPIVVLNYVQEGGNCCTVLVDNEQVGYLAARHLLELGRRRIAFFAGRDYYQPVRERRLGVHRALAEVAGAELEEFDTEGLVFEDGVQAGKSLAERPPSELPTGIIGVTDELANGIAHVLQSTLAARIPDDVAVVGCEDNRTARGGPLPLTAIDLAGVRMGEEAITLLLEELSSGRDERGISHVHRTVMLAPSIVVRASTVRDDLGYGRFAGPS